MERIQNNQINRTKKINIYLKTGLDVCLVIDIQ